MCARIRLGSIRNDRNDSHCSQSGYLRTTPFIPASRHGSDCRSEHRTEDAQNTWWNQLVTSGCGNSCNQWSGDHEIRCLAVCPAQRLRLGSCCLTIRRHPQFRRLHLTCAQLGIKMRVSGFQGIGHIQETFAGLFHMSVGTLRNREQGRRRHGGPAAAVLIAISNDPKHVVVAMNTATQPSQNLC